MLEVFGVAGGVAALLKILWDVTTSFRGKEHRRMQAEAAKAVTDATAAEASLPHVQRSLELGNVVEAVSVQQTIINGLREHIVFQDERVERLVEEIANKDAKIAELLTRVEEAETAVNEARAIIRTIQGEAAV